MRTLPAGREWNGAKADLEKALSCGADGPEVHLSLGRITESAGKPEQALKHYQDAIKRDPKFAPGYVAAAVVTLNLGGSRAQAISWLEQAAKLDEKLADPHYRLCALLKESSRARARQHCEQYLKLAPEGDWASDARDLLRNLK
ncbi:MAG: hypothetical protein R3F43_16385 [bacterium]